MENQEKILVNLLKEICAAVANEGGYKPTRYNGGWTKRIERLDKSVDTGYSLVGEFANKSDTTALQVPGLFLDCDIGGSRKNQDKIYTLFELRNNGTVEIITQNKQTRSWAVDLWPDVEEYFEWKNKPEGRQAEIVKEIESLEARLRELNERLLLKI